MNVYDASREPRAPSPETVEILTETLDPVTRWVVLPSLAALDDPPVFWGEEMNEDFFRWARACGAVDFAFTTVVVTIANRSDTHLTLRDLRAVIVNRQEPLSGALIRVEPAGQAVAPELEFDLEQQRPELWQVDEYTRAPIGARPFIERTHVTLAPDESEKFIITAQIRRSLCEWQLVLVLRPNDGEPEFTARPTRTFCTSGLPADGFASVLSWQWDLRPPKFMPSSEDLGWCRVGHEADDPFRHDR